MKLKAKFNGVFPAQEPIFSFTTADKWQLNNLLELVAKIKNKGSDVLEVEVKEYKSKRSVQQNSTMWEMITILTNAIHGRNDAEMVWETYCEMLLQYGQEPFYLEGLSETKTELQKYFRAIRIVEKRVSKGKETCMYQCFHGSSKFNTRQMFDFMNCIKEELKQYGIDYQIGENNKKLKERL